MRKLELGSGNRPRAGYEHLDIDPNCPDLDFCCSFESIPVDNDTFDELLSVHSLEHISWRSTVRVLKEWYRVLRPGGKLHIDCPNLRWICETYLRNGQELQNDLNSLQDEAANHLLVKGWRSHTLWANFKLFSSTANGDIHLAGLDAFTLTHQLEEAGFSQVIILKDSSSLIVEAFK